MRVLLTGDQGFIGRPLAAALRSWGYDVVGFDQRNGQDLANSRVVNTAALGCDAIVHAAGLASDTAGSNSEIMATNTLGTWHVLLAAQGAGIGRVVHFSSAQVLGISEGEGRPVSFPIDDAHPRNATRPYGISKLLAEDLCERVTAGTSISTVCLRPVGVWTEETYAAIKAARLQRPDFEWEPFWEFGAFVDMRDVCTAVRTSIEKDVPCHVRALLCAADITGSRPTLELVERLMPDVEWRPGALEAYAAEPYRALVDTSVARDQLGWSPQHTWAGWEAERGRLPNNGPGPTA